MKKHVEKKARCSPNMIFLKVRVANMHGVTREEATSLCWTLMSRSYFQNAEAVNSSLRGLAEIIRRRKSLAAK